MRFAIEIERSPQISVVYKSLTIAPYPVVEHGSHKPVKWFSLGRGFGGPHFKIPGVFPHIAPISFEEFKIHISVTVEREEVSPTEEAEFKHIAAEILESVWVIDHERADIGGINHRLRIDLFQKFISFFEEQRGFSRGAMQSAKPVIAPCLVPHFVCAEWRYLL